MTIKSLFTFTFTFVFAFYATYALAVEDRLPASTTQAQPSFAESEQPDPRLFGWDETHNRWHEKGYDFNATYKIESVFGDGGLKSGSGVLGNLDLTLDLNLEKIAGLNGFSFFIYGLGDHGDDPTDFVGDSFATSNLQSPDTFKIYEFYLKHTYQEKFVSILGFRDLNADFYSTESAKNLLNSSFGISASLSQTGANGPSIFPTTALAGSVYYDSESFYFGAGVFNAVAGNPTNPYGTHWNTKFDDGELFISEMGIKSQSNSLKSEFSLGAWQYSKAIEKLDATGTEKNSGLYAMADVSLNEMVSCFARFGNATASVNIIGEAMEYGLRLNGILSERPKDSLSAGIATIKASRDFHILNPGSNEETAMEINYQFVFDRGFKITPDYQYIWQPGFSSSGPNAYVYTLRFEFSL